MAVVECFFPPLPHYLDGTPTKRILAVVARAYETDMSTIALRTELPMEVVYGELTALLGRSAIALREDKRGYPLLRRNRS